MWWICCSWESTLKKCQEPLCSKGCVVHCTWRQVRSPTWPGEFEGQWTRSCIERHELYVLIKGGGSCFRRQVDQTVGSCWEILPSSRHVKTWHTDRLVSLLAPCPMQTLYMSGLEHPLSVKRCSFFSFVTRVSALQCGQTLWRRQPFSLPIQAQCTHGVQLSMELDDPCRV